MYQIRYYANDLNTYEKTIFFKEFKTTSSRPYWIFSKNKLVTKPIVLFAIKYNVESVFIIKEVMQKIIEEASIPYFSSVKNSK